MTPEQKRKTYENCTRFLNYHYPKPLDQQMREIAESEYAKLPRDMYGNGGFVAQFEEEIAQLLGKESAVFMPSGTMAQQIALRIWCDRAGNNKVAFHPTCHLEIHEQGAYRELHHLVAMLLGKPDRLFTLADLKRAHDIAALLIELPQREIGGQLPTWDELTEGCDWARSHGIKLHLDGARLWECKPFYKRSYADIAAPFDSVYVSFYKILGGLPGAVLAGPTDLIAEARIWQRRHGGNLVHLAANAITAKLGMDHHLPLIPLYCMKAEEIVNAIKDLDGIRVVPEHPPTNLFHLYLMGDKRAFEDEAWKIAHEEKTFLFGSLSETTRLNESKLELTIAGAALDWKAGEVKDAFARVLKAGSLPAHV